MVYPSALASLSGEIGGYLVKIKNSDCWLLATTREKLGIKGAQKK